MVKLLESIKKKLAKLSLEEQEEYLVDVISKLKDEEMIKELEAILKEVREQIQKNKGEGILEGVLKDAAEPEEPKREELDILELRTLRKDYERKGELAEKLPDTEVKFEPQEFKTYKIQKLSGIDYIGKAEGIQRVSNFLRENPTIGRDTELEYIRKLTGIDDTETLRTYAAEVTAFMESKLESPEEWIKKYARKRSF